MCHHNLHCQKSTQTSRVLSKSQPAGRWKKDNHFPVTFLFSATVSQNHNNQECDSLGCPMYVAVTHSMSSFSVTSLLPWISNLKLLLRVHSGTIVCRNNEIHLYKRPAVVQRVLGTTTPLFDALICSSTNPQSH